MIAKKKTCDGKDCNGKLQYIWANVTDGDGVRLRYCKNCYFKMEGKPTIKRQALKRTSTPIPKFSTKRAKENVAYSALRKVFLDTHPMCQAKLEGCQIHSCDVHHMISRSGNLLCDSSEWLAICRFCHSYITDHPKFAIEHGFSKLRLSK